MTALNSSTPNCEFFWTHVYLTLPLRDSSWNCVSALRLKNQNDGGYLPEKKVRRYLQPFRDNTQVWRTDRQTDTRRRLVLLLRTASRAKTKTKVIIWRSHLSPLINFVHCKWHAAQKHVASASATASNTSSGVSVRHANIALQHYFIILSFYFYSNLIIVGRVAWSVSGMSRPWTGWNVVNTPL